MVVLLVLVWEVVMAGGGRGMLMWLLLVLLRMAGSMRGWQGRWRGRGVDLWDSICACVGMVRMVLHTAACSCRTPTAPRAVECCTRHTPGQANVTGHGLDGCSLARGCCVTAAAAAQLRLLLLLGGRRGGRCRLLLGT